MAIPTIIFKRFVLKRGYYLSDSVIRCGSLIWDQDRKCFIDFNEKKLDYVTDQKPDNLNKTDLSFFDRRQEFNKRIIMLNSHSDLYDDSLIDEGLVTIDEYKAMIKKRTIMY